MADIGTAEASNSEKATTRSSDLTASFPPSQQSHSITSPHLSKSLLSSRMISPAITTSKSAGGVGFLDLPPEIRNMVYKYLRPEQDYYLFHLGKRKQRVFWRLSLRSTPWVTVPSDESPSLFLLAKTSRTIYVEALPVWYQSFAYTIDGRNKTGAHLRKLHTLPKCVCLHNVKSLNLLLPVDDLLADTLNKLFEVFKWGDKIHSLGITFFFRVYPKPRWTKTPYRGPTPREQRLLDIANGQVLPLWKNIKYRSPIPITHSSGGLSLAAKAFKKIIEDAEEKRQQIMGIKE
ncbi:hypothetical protein C1H76_4687 [Elsinoe australis]|uniref:F-box domain-containing protein n=1 Tax=Elsinoe australis TaxID=40998 RepID=A0A4U7AXV5_9PEZI|nr:hypothetical protein C1H76_4687 [Elsinoe australis]